VVVGGTGGRGEWRLRQRPREYGNARVSREGLDSARVRALVEAEIIFPQRRHINHAVVFRQVAGVLFKRVLARARARLLIN